MTRGWAALWACVLLVALASCDTHVTEVLIEIDSDAPLSRVLTITARASTAMDPGAPRTWIRGAGVDGGIQLPASFAVLRWPQAPAEEQVTLTIDASLAATPTEPAVTIERILRFTYVPNQTVRLPVFIAMSCGALATGCHALPASQCTLSALCEEMGLTCDDRGRCSATTVQPLPTLDVSVVDTSDLAVPESCVPSCVNRVCGPDGCGGHCGSCAPGTTCTTDGHCVCTPACAGRSCGDDGCGGTCGTCGSGQMCDATGQCVMNACVPNCSARACGPDPQCGTSCGDCGIGYSCDGSGQCVCVVDCGGRTCGPDGCGGSCGGCSGGQNCDGSGNCVCPSGQAFCGSSCIDVTSNASNCGGCANVCPSGETCMNGSCICPSDHQIVGGVCLPSCVAALAASGLPNGGYGCCNTACAEMEVGPTYDCTHCCSAAGNAACGCPTGQVDCGGSCVSTDFDPTNCGACGNTCTGGTNPGCCYGGCTDLDSDPTNCGSCGNNCSGGSCTGGLCF